MLAIFLYMYFPDRGCVHTLLTLYVYATKVSYSSNCAAIWRWKMSCLISYSLRRYFAVLCSSTL